jgi:hypothetical protein
MAVLTSMMTTSLSFATMELGTLDEEEDEENNSGYDTSLDPGDTNSAYSGFPAEEHEVDEATAGPQLDELNAASTPEQGESVDSEREGNLPDEGEAVVTGGNDNKEEETGSDSTAYKEFLGCLSGAESGDGSPTEQEVQDCNELSYGGEESNQLTPIENNGEGNDQGGISGDNPTDDNKIPNGKPQTDTAN